FIAAKGNFGPLPALGGAAALLVDYVLTVAVSIVAGVLAIVAFVPAWSGFTVEISIGCIVLLTLSNLRGVRETGSIFALPTYAFIASIFAMLAVGISKCIASSCPSTGMHVTPDPLLAARAVPIGLFAILHAFSSGATALTGV